MKMPKSMVIFAGTFLAGVLTVAGMFYFDQSPPSEILLPNSRWVPILFKGINRITDLAEIQELRKVHVNNGDIEVRIWRGAFLGSTEGVFLNRIDGQWSGQHLRVKTGESADDLSTEVVPLKSPKSGWALLWRSIVDEGLLTLPDPSEINCEYWGGVDGIVYVVEINQGTSYRTYMYHGGPCAEGKQMDKIGEIIGFEFDTGRRECKGDEWFACMTMRVLQERSLDETRSIYTPFNSQRRVGSY
jgi:hypothetical protein